MDSFVILSQQGAWIDPELLREASGEVFGVVKSYLECYLRDVHVAGDAVLENSADAMHALGCCYANGIGVRTNKLQAGFWFDKATGQVNKESDNPYSAEAEAYSQMGEQGG